MNSNIERRTLEELFARYELEPTIIDVVVEGGFDRDVLSSHIGTHQVIYDIDSIEIPSSLVLKHGLTLGNKQRVIVLARELLAAGYGAGAICLVDRDLDHWFGPLESTTGLRWTQYCSLEMHFLCNEMIRRILITTAKARITNFDLFISSFLAALADVYALRLTSKKLNMGVSWSDYMKYLSRKGNSITFNCEKFFQNNLVSNGFSKQLPEFKASFTEWRHKLTGDCRFHTCGHDYMKLLAWSLREFGGVREFASEAAIERIFVLLSVHVEELADEISA